MTAALSRRLVSRAEIKSLLSTPTWSVNELFVTDKEVRKIHEPPTEQTLEKLLKQSALKSAKDDPARRNMLLEQLTNQLVFVEHVAGVDTAGVKPLVRIGGNAMAQEFSLDKVEHSGIDEMRETDAEWRPTDLASQRNGKFFVLHEGLRKE